MALSRIAAVLVAFALIACEGDAAPMPAPEPTRTPTPEPTLTMEERILSAPGHTQLPKDSIIEGIFWREDQDYSDNYHTHYCVVAPGNQLLIPHIHNSDEKFPKQRQMGDFGGSWLEREVECLDHAYPDWRDVWDN